MTSRCIWLTHTRDYLKQDAQGKKYFKVRKNTDTLELSPPPLHPKIPEIQKSHTPNLSINKSPSVSPRIQQLIKETDSQIQSLHKRYQELLSRVKQIETTRCIQKNLDSLKSVKKITFPDPNTLSKLTIHPRSNSTLNMQKPNLFNSCFFTKNRPKIILNNPITGLKPNYPY